MDQIRKVVNDEPIKKERGLGFKRFDSISGDPRITVITTGGTIVQQFDEKQGGYVPKTSGLELIKSINSKINTEKIDLVEFAMIDSRAVDTKFLYELSALVNAKINDDRIDAVVIIHGTDTMEITAYFLHRTVNSPRKPIVITGAMRVVSNSDYDGIANITNAIKQVSNEESCTHGAGVSINFAGKIHSPIHVIKSHSFAIDPFDSGMYGIIGIMHTNTIEWLNANKKSLVIPLPSRLDLISSVPIIYAYPNATANFLDGFRTFKAIVIIGYGSGNVNDATYIAIKGVIEAGVKVVMVTNCRYGGMFPDYGGIGGNQSLKDLGVIMANELNAYQAMVVASLVFENDNLNNIAPESLFQNKLICN